MKLKSLLKVPSALSLYANYGKISEFDIDYAHVERATLQLSEELSFTVELNCWHLPRICYELPLHIFFASDVFLWRRIEKCSRKFESWKQNKKCACVSPRCQSTGGYRAHTCRTNHATTGKSNAINLTWLCLKPTTNIYPIMCINWATRCIYVFACTHAIPRLRCEWGVSVRASTLYAHFIIPSTLNAT